MLEGPRILLDGGLDDLLEFALAATTVPLDYLKADKDHFPYVGHVARHKDWPHYSMDRRGNTKYKERERWRDVQQVRNCLGVIKEVGAVEKGQTGVTAGLDR